MSSFFLFLLTTLADKPAMLSRFIYRLHGCSSCHNVFLAHFQSLTKSSLSNLIPAVT